MPYQIGTGGIANAAVTNALLANNSVANSNLQSNAVGNSNLQAGSVGNPNIGPYALDGGQAASQYAGQNMIVDAQFQNAAINTVRLADPGVVGTWATSSAPVTQPYIAGKGHISSATNFTMGVTSNIPVGSAVFVSIFTTTAQTYTVTDTKSNAYSQITYQAHSGTPALNHYLIGCPVTTTALTSGTDIISVTCSTGANIHGVVFVVPLGVGWDTNNGTYATTAAISVNTPTSNQTGDVNFVIVNNLNNNFTFNAGGGTPSGWIYMGGNGTTYTTEAAWQYASSVSSQSFSTNYSSAPTNGWLATAIGVESSGNSGHLTATAVTTPTAVMPLMPTHSVNPPMYVNPGEQYFLSLSANVPGTVNCNVGIEMVLNNGTTLKVGATNHGFFTVRGSVTIPPGASSAYVQVSTNSASGTVTGISLINPYCALSSLSGSAWSVNDNGITVSGINSTGQAQLSVNDVSNVPSLSMPTNVISEASPSTVYAIAGNTGAPNESIQLIIDGPASTADNLDPYIALQSNTKNNTGDPNVSIGLGNTILMYCDGSGTHITSTLYGTGGNVTIGDSVRLAGALALTGSSGITAPAVWTGGVSGGSYNLATNLLLVTGTFNLQGTNLLMKRTCAGAPNPTGTQLYTALVASGILA